MDTRILVVDDEETLAEALRFNLEAAGYAADVAHSAEQALMMPLRDYSLILLDIMMGDISGLQMARMLKNNPDTAHIPVIFCTARDSDHDMVHGLDLGADDYITKPYSIGNVLARVRSVLRRTAPAAQPRVDAGAGTDSSQRRRILSYETLTADPDSKSCSVDGSEVRMPRKEFEILCTLMASPGRVFSRAELLRRIWPDDVVVLDRVVDVNVTRLRSKLGRYGKNIVTRPGYGYVFQK